MTQKINIVLFGIGKAGSAFINKVIKNRKELVLESQLDLRFPVITSSTTAFFEKDGVNYSWEANFIQFAIPFKLDDILYYLAENNLDNAILVDATSSEALAAEYPDLIKSGFNLVSINSRALQLPANFKRGVEFLAASRGLTFNYLSSLRPGKEAAADALFEAVLEIAEKTKTKVA